MSKSYGNTIALSEKDDVIRAKTRVMVTDPARKRRTDPGNPMSARCMIGTSYSHRPKR